METPPSALQAMHPRSRPHARLRSASWMALAVLAVLVGGCRLHRHRHHRHTPAVAGDPRRIWTTGCADSRFVTASPIAWIGPTPLATLPFVAAGGAMQLVGAVQDGHLRAVLHGHRDPIDIASGDITHVSAVATGHAIFVAWSVAPRGVGIAMIHPDGSVQRLGDAHGTGLAYPDGNDPVLAFGNGQVAMVCDASVPWGNAVFVMRWDAASGRLLWLPVPIEGPVVGAHAITWAGDKWSVVWVSRQKLRYTTLQFNAIHADPIVDLVVADAPVDRVSAAYGNGRVAVAWSDRRTGSEVLYTTAVNVADAQRTTAEQRLSARYDPEATPSIVWDGGAFGMAWWEPVGGGNPRAFFALIDHQGNRIGTHLQVPDAARVGLRGTALAWTGRSYLLAIGQDDGTVVARITGPRGCDTAP